MNEEQKAAIEGFFDAAVSDEALAEQLAELAGRAGYSFTAVDLLELGEARPLSDEETEEAAGGFAGARKIPLVRPGQLQTHDLVYRPDGNPPQATTLPSRTDGPQSPKIVSI